MTCSRCAGARCGVEGNLQPFMANLLYFKAVLAAGRRGRWHAALGRRPAGGARFTQDRPMPDPAFEPITGRYLRLNIEGVPQRVYVEEAGQGIPLLCLHTARPTPGSGAA
jgi:hypothetical protein